MLSCYEKETLLSKSIPPSTVDFNLSESWTDLHSGADDVKASISIEEVLVSISCSGEDIFIQLSQNHASAINVSQAGNLPSCPCGTYFK